MQQLTLQALKTKAKQFAQEFSQTPQKELFGVSDGKAIGTFVEQAFTQYLASTYKFERGNAAKGIDFPSLNIDLKVTSINQPQSSCPFRSARQKIFGLGYGLLLFVYSKTDHPKQKSAQLEFLHTIVVDAACTADYTLTKTLRQMLEQDANEEDIVALLFDRNLPLDEIEAASIARELRQKPPEQGYLTISNALQWRLQYARVLIQAGDVAGLVRL
jgi:hypothetical protein